MNAQEHRTHQVMLNTLTNYLRQGMQILVFLIITPFIASSLGQEKFGLWSLIQATVGIFSLLDLGLATSVVKYVADARGRNDPERLRAMVATFFWVYVILGCIMFFTALGFSLKMIPLLKIPEQYAEVGRAVFIIVAFRVALEFPLRMFNGVLTGYQKQWWSNLIQVIGFLAYAVIAWWVLKYTPTLRALAWVNFGANTVVGLVSMLICVCALDGSTVSPRYVRVRLMPEVASFSMYFFLIQISGLIYMRVDLLIIQSFLSLTAVAVYTVASRIAENAQLFCKQMTNALTPLFAEMRGGREEENIRRLYMMGTKISTGLATPLMVGLFWFAEDLVVAWMGEEFRSAASPCRLLIVAMSISVVHANTANVLMMTDHHKFVSKCFVIGQFFNLFLTIMLIQFWGMNGVAIATLTTSVLIDMIVIQAKANQIYHFNLWVFYSKGVFPSVFPALVMLGAIWGLQQIYTHDSLFHIAALELLACAVFGALFIRLGLSAEERHYLKQRLLRRRKAKDIPVPESNEPMT